MAGLDHSLEQWRRSLEGSAAVSKGDLDELESHVREIVGDLLPVGLSPDEATLIALRRMGDPSVLKLEFEKVNPGTAWARRFYWMGLGFVGLTAAWTVARFASYSAAVGILAAGGSGKLAAAGYFGGLTWFIALGIVAVWGSAHRPNGREARAFQGAMNWVEAHPIASGTGCLLLLAAVLTFDNAHYFVFANGAYLRSLPMVPMWIGEVAAFSAAPLILIGVARHLAGDDTGAEAAPS